MNCELGMIGSTRSRPIENCAGPVTRFTGSGRMNSVDGGIWANNPIRNAVVDTLACYDLSRECIRILSISTGDEILGLDKGVRNNGFWVGYS